MFHANHPAFNFFLLFIETQGVNCPIYTGGGSSVWDELEQRTVARLCISTGKQRDHPSTQANVSR